MIKKYLLTFFILEGGLITLSVKLGTMNTIMFWSGTVLAVGFIVGMFINDMGDDECQ